MKIVKLLGGCFLAALAVASCKKQETVNLNNKLNGSDTTFIRLAGLSNSSEIATAKIAVVKATDSLVLAYGQQMLSEYTKAQNDLKVMGTIVGFNVTDSTDAALDSTITVLNSVTVTGRTFDSTYIHSQLAQHTSMISFYTDEVKNGQQTNVQAYANTILQNIQTEKQAADSIATAFK